jgi:hypothetical protein
MGTGLLKMPPEMRIKSILCEGIARSQETQAPFRKVRGFFFVRPRMDIKTAKRKYQQQKANAKHRGIGWQFTFDGWLAWWGDDLDQRGSKAWSLQMQRFHDQGPYAPWNVRKGRPIDNRKTAANVQRAEESASRKMVHQATLNNAGISPSKDWDYVDDDDKELEKMFGVKNSYRWSS